MACSMDVCSETFHSLVVIFVATFFCSQTFYVSEWQGIDLPLI